MREIKFRAWDKKNKKWLLGYEYPNLGGFSLVGECVIMGEFANLFRPLLRLKEIEITQYTGLKDKNGKEIYEGDILKIDGGGEPSIGSVGFERGCFTFNADWINKEKRYMPELYRYTFFAELKEGKLFKDCIVVEIIGNIYENPELK